MSNVQQKLKVMDLLSCHYHHITQIWSKNNNIIVHHNNFWDNVNHWAWPTFWMRRRLAARRSQTVWFAAGCSAPAALLFGDVDTSSHYLKCWAEPDTPERKKNTFIFKGDILWFPEQVWVDLCAIQNRFVAFLFRISCIKRCRASVTLDPKTICWPRPQLKVYTCMWKWMQKRQNYTAEHPWKKLIGPPA